MQPMVVLMKRFGKKELLVIACVCLALVHAVLALCPVGWIQRFRLLFVYAIFMTAGRVVAILIPEAMLADVIDYDTGGDAVYSRILTTEQIAAVVAYERSR